MNERELRLEDELEWLRRLTDSDGWKRLIYVHTKVLEEESRKIRGEQCDNRDWHAGFVSAYERLLRWPDQQIRAITSELKKQKNHN